MSRGMKFGLTVVFLAILLLAIFSVSLLENRLLPMISVSAKSRARLYASELMVGAVADSLDPDERLTEVIYSEGEVKAIETNIAAVSRLRTDSVSRAAGELAGLEELELSIPIGSLLGVSILSGRGFEIPIRLLRSGDISAELYSEFIETGINQTLHRIYLRMRTSLNMLLLTDNIRLELSNDVLVSETVIVGRVPDAYTAINRFEIDENEENDLNDYAASLP